MKNRKKHEILRIVIKASVAVGVLVVVAIIISKVFISKSLASLNTIKAEENDSSGIIIETFAATLVKGKVLVTLPSCEESRDGYTFIGWEDGENLYSEGYQYTKTAGEALPEGKWAIATTTVVNTLPTSLVYIPGEEFIPGGLSASVVLDDGKTVISLKDAFDSYGLKIAGPLVEGQDEVKGFFTYGNKDYAVVLEGMALSVALDNKTGERKTAEVTGFDGADSFLEYANSASFTVSKPKKTGYTFIGWNTASDCSGISYRNGDVVKAGEVSTLYSIWRESATLEKMLDLGYWYVGIDEDVYSARLAEAAMTVPTTGAGYCALWVSYVYQAAGLGFVGGDARDMWAYFGVTDSTSQIKEGMMIAVPHSPSCALGWEYGHVGVIVKNPDYVDLDSYENRMTETEMKAKLIDAMEQKENLENIIKNAETSIDENADLSNARKNVSDTQKKLEEKVAMARADLNEVEGTILMLQDQLNILTTKIEHNSEYSEIVDGFKYEYDCYGHEKWVVVHNNGTVKVTPLSGWISYYNATNEIKWGWGHQNVTEPINFYQDIPSTVAFVVMTDGGVETKETTIASDKSDKETTAEAVTEAGKSETKAEKTTTKAEKATTAKEETTAEPTTTAEPKTTAQPKTTKEEVTEKTTEKATEKPTTKTTESPTETKAPSVNSDSVNEKEEEIEPEVPIATENETGQNEGR